jgi:hypothetical protein
MAAYNDKKRTRLDGTDLEPSSASSAATGSDLPTARGPPSVASTAIPPPSAPPGGLTRDDLNDVVGAALRTALSSYDDKISRRFAANEARIMVLEEANRKQQSAIDELHERVARVERDLGGLESASPEEQVDNLVFDRPLDLAVLRLNTNIDVALEEVRRVAATLCAEASIDAKHVEFVGDASGRNFSLKFLGEPTLGARRAHKVQQLLRPTARGAPWRVLEVPVPDGSSTTLYVSGDKNGKMVQCERHLKALAKILKTKYKFECMLNKKDGTLSHQLRPLAKVNAIKKGTSTVQWNLEVAGELGINRDEVARDFEAAAASHGFTNWR